jgi:hypothetical protein
MRLIRSLSFTKSLSFAGLGLIALSLSSAAQPQAPRGPPCVDRTRLIAQLHDAFGELVIGRGLANGGFVFEILAGQSGSWTLIATTPQGMSCFVAAGEAWEPVPKPDIFAGRE